MSIAILAAAALSAGSPIYLSCELNQSRGPLAVEVSLNEDDQSAIVSLPSGRVVKRLAVFAPAKVTIADENMVWTIDRKHMSFSRVVRIGEKDFSEAGTCKLQPAPADRAF